MVLVLGFVSPAAADWREDIGVFRIGIVSSGNAYSDLSALEPFRLALSQEIGMEVEFFRARSSRVLMDAIASDRIEYALLSASGYALASLTCQCVEPLVMPRSADSSDSFHIVAIGRTGNGSSIEGLQSSRNLILSGEGIVGAAFVNHLLSLSSAGNEFEPIEFVSLPSSEAAFQSFLVGDYDVLFGWSSMTGEEKLGFSRGTLKELIRRSEDGQSSFEVLWNSPPIPHRPHVIRKKLPGELKTILRDFMVNLFERHSLAYDTIEPFHGGGFSASHDGRFKILERFLVTLDEEAANSQTGSSTN